MHNLGFIISLGAKKMQKLLLSSFFIIFSFLFLSTELRAEEDNKTLHAILIGDTASNLNVQSKADLFQIHEGVKFIAKSLNLKPQIHLIKGHDVTIAHVLDKIEKLPIKSDDAVIFYFTGHGFNYEKSHWPSLFFFTEKNSLDLETVISKISDKKPRFALILADCCNVTPNEFTQGPGDKYFDYAYERRERINCDLESLFLKSKGILVISASSPGEFSWANERGGIFTTAFLDSFGTPSNRPKRAWSDLLQVLSFKTKGIQTPQYQFVY